MEYQRHALVILLKEYDKPSDLYWIVFKGPLVKHALLWQKSLGDLYTSSICMTYTSLLYEIHIPCARHAFVHVWG